MVLMCFLSLSFFFFFFFSSVCHIDGGNLEGKSSAVDANIPYGAADYWYITNIPISHSQRRDKVANGNEVAVLPVRKNLLEKLRKAEEKVLAGSY